MKKITLLKKFALIILTIVSQTSSAQTWEMSDNTAFGTYIPNISTLHSFKGNIYAGLTMNNAYGARLFSSYTGDNGTWYEQTSFASVINMDEYGTTALNSTTAGSGWMYLGTKNITTGPRVYTTTDGFSWDTLPQIPHGAMIGYNTEISSMACFNATGAEDDTLFVAVENSLSMVEIWKTYITGGTWTNVSTISGTSRINDMEKFNNKLFACTNNGLIYESSDGNNWTMNVPADTGFNDSNNFSFESMVVFQNKLYVSTNNFISGAQIWNTTDGLSWTQVMSDGFTNGGSMGNINDMLAANGILWISAESFMSGLASFSPEGSGAGRGGALFTYIYNSTDGTNYINQNNDGFISIDPLAVNRVGTLAYYNNFVYQASDNSGYGVSGEVWRGCQAPTPSISPLAGNGCQGNPIWINDTLYSANLNEWYVNDTLWSSGFGGFFYTPTCLGLQTIKLIERNGSCVDSATTTINILPSPTSSATSLQTYCYGTIVTLVDTVSGGTGPYTIEWHNEVGFSATGDSIVLTATGGFDVQVYAVDANGCSSENSSSGFFVTPSTDLIGHVSYSGGSVSNGSVVAYKYIPTYTYFDTVQVTSLNASGDYVFTALNGDNYLIKVFADTLIYPLLNPTYYGNEWAWDSATVFVHGCSVNDTANITMIEELGVGSGIGMITGTILEGVGFGSSLMVNNGFMRLPGEPIPGIDVKLGKNPGGAMVTSGSTNGSGVYTFTGVDFNTGADYYTVYVDIPGLGRDSSYSVTVNATTNQFYNLDYYVDSTTIYIVDSSAVGINNLDAALENTFAVFPNPSLGNSTIEYVLENSANVSLSIYNVLGEKISELVNQNQKAGVYKYSTNNKNLVAGIYFITLITDGKSSTQRLIITE